MSELETWNANDVHQIVSEVEILVMGKWSEIADYVFASWTNLKGKVVTRAKTKKNQFIQLHCLSNKDYPIRRPRTHTKFSNPPKI